MSRCQSVVLFAASLGLLAIAGCGDGKNSELIAKHRATLLLAEEPDGAQHVADLREAVLGGSQADDETAVEVATVGVESDDASADKAPATDASDVVLVGIVGGLTNPYKETQPDFPFAKDKAQFFLADVGVVAEAEAEGHHHADGEECAFCAARAHENADMLAVVQFTDENGKVLPVDARDLFDLKGKETVVIRGKALSGAGETLVVNASGLYVRR